MATKEKQPETQTPPLTDPLLVPPEEGKEKTVTVKASALQELLDNYKEMSAQLKRLESAADKGRLQSYDSRQPQQELVHIVRLNTLGGKVIISWPRMLQDEPITSPDGRNVGARQIRKLVFADGSEVTMDYLDSIKQIVQVDAEIVSRTQTKDGEILKVLNTADGKEYDIETKFIN